MTTSSNQITIGTLARLAGVNVETIRFYQRKGLLAEPPKPYGSIRRYADDGVARVRFIKSAQRLGFNLNEIGDLLQLDRMNDCAQARALAQHKLDIVREKLADLARMEHTLSQLVDACNQAGDARVSCPLIDSMQQDAESGSLLATKM